MSIKVKKPKSSEGASGLPPKPKRGSGGSDSGGRRRSSGGLMGGKRKSEPLLNESIKLDPDVEMRTRHNSFVYKDPEGAVTLDDRLRARAKSVRRKQRQAGTDGRRASGRRESVDWAMKK